MLKRTSRSGKTDPDSQSKDQAEEDIALFFGEQFEAQFDDLLDEMGDEDPSPPPPAFWEKWSGIFLAFLVPMLTGMAVSASETEALSLGIEIDHDEIVAEASNWARTYGFNMVSDLNENTRNHLQNALRNYFDTPDRNLDLLIGDLSSMFTPRRAQTIAVTEVTRGFENGKRIYAEKLEIDGILTEPRWYTMKDNNVCVICEPNDEKLRSEGWTVAEIPAHPNDRCWTELELVT